MKLHALNRKFLVPKAHDGSGAIFLGGPCTHFQFFGQAVFFHNERVVARGDHGCRQATENTVIIVSDGAGFAVHQVGSPDYFSAESLPNGLMAETYSQDRNFTREMPDQSDANASILRRTGSGRNHNLLRLQFLNVENRYLIIAPDFDLRTKLTNVLHQVVSERVVVVENENHDDNLLLHYRSKRRTEANLEDAESPDIILRAIRVPKSGIDGTLSTRHYSPHSVNAISFVRRGTSMTEAPEKRAARRFALRIPVSVGRGENSEPNEAAQLRDVSARGISLYLDSSIENGSALSFTLTLPPEITLTESIRVQCKGKIVRVENDGTSGKMAVAAVIEEYEFVPES
jgi:hypothetical protein